MKQLVLVLVSLLSCSDDTLSIGSETTGTVAPGEVDTYRIELEAGDWVSFQCLGILDNSPVARCETLTLLDESMTQVAEGPPGFLAMLLGDFRTHVARSGTYFLQVHGREPSEYALAYEYRLRASRLVDGEEDVNMDLELGDDAASARPVSMVEGGGAFLAGMFRDDADVDVFSFELDGAGGLSLGLWIDPAGAIGNGSTSEPSRMRLWITDATGTSILTRVSLPWWGERFYPHVPTPGTYLLFIDNFGSWRTGPNDFYGIWASLGSDYPQEKEIASTQGSNDSRELAQASDDTFSLSTGVVSYLPPGDVDYLGFDMTESGTVHAYCGAHGEGSGVLGLHVEVRDNADAVLAEADESIGPIRDLALPGPGRYWVRLSATGQDPEIVGNYVRCGLSAK